MKKVVKIFFVITLTCISNSIFSQSTTWQRIFGGPRNDFSTLGIETIDGNYLMVGSKAVINTNTGFYISQTYLVKFNIFGIVIWEKLFGDSIQSNYPSSAIEMFSGNILITYISNNNNEGNILKLNMNGELIWNKTYNDSVTGFFNLSLVDNSNSILINGDYYTGTTYLPNLTKLDTNGNFIWTKHCNENFGAIGYYNTDEGYYAAGQTGNYSAFISKSDTSGNFIWRKLKPNPYGNHFFRLISLTKISSLSYLVIGNIANSKKGGLYSMKIDTAGNTLFGRDYFSDSVSGTFISRTLNNQFAIAGASTSEYSYNGISLILDSLGNILKKSYSINNPNDYPIYTKIFNCSDSGFIISGDYTYSNTDYSDILFIKTDKNLIYNTVGISSSGENFIPQQTEVLVFPNPFNPQLNVKIKVAKKSRVQIQIFNVSGQQIVNLVNINVNPDDIIKIDANKLNLSSGIYFVNIRNERFSILKKVIYLK